jgi:hypothetical protein
MCGAIALGVAALTLERPLREAWDLHRLRTDAGYFRTCLHAEPGAPARTAVEKFLREAQGKQSAVCLFFAPSDLDRARADPRQSSSIHEEEPG